MAFIEVQFPTTISYGSKGGPGFNTNIVVSDSGFEERVARWQSAKQKFDVKWGIKSREQMAQVLEFYIAVQGALNGFRFKSWLDYNTATYGHRVPEGSTDNTTAFDQNFGVGDGSTTQFQLAKTYTVGSTARTRNITKPVNNSTFKLAVDGTLTGSGWSLDFTTGIVTFGSAPSDGVLLTWGGEFDTPCRFGKQVDTILMASIEDFGYGNLDSIELVEISDGLFVNDDAYTGGAAEIAITTDYTLSASYCRAYLFEPQTSGLSIILPDPTTTPTGGPIFWVGNLGSDSITVKTYAGSSLATLSAGNGIDVLLTVDGSGNKSWTLI